MNILLLFQSGSFHFEGEEGRFCNASTVLNHAGEALWVQNKLKRYSFGRIQIEENPSLQTLCKTSAFGGYERIREGSDVYFADTPLGRLTVSICLDQFHKEHTEIYKNSGANVFFVPAMTPTNGRFLRSAGFFADANMASTFVSNSGFIASKIEDCIAEKGSSFYLLPCVNDPCVTAWVVVDGLLVYNLVNNKLIIEANLD